MSNGTDNNQPIRNLQRALRRLAKVDESLNDVIVDGQYGAQTAAAVSAFQNKFGLPETGEADRVTFDKIMDEYIKLLEVYTEAKTLDAYPSPFFTVDIDDSNEIVYIIQAIVAGLAKRFENINLQGVTGVYDSETADAVKEIQRISGLPQTGVVDKATWDAMAALYEANISKSRINPFDPDSEVIIRRDKVLYAPFNNDDYRL